LAIAGATSGVGIYVPPIGINSTVSELGVNKDKQEERIGLQKAKARLAHLMLLSDRLQRTLALAKRKNTQIGLLYMDLDGFKHINDTSGMRPDHYPHLIRCVA
jgi:GGDEF domain-containing protein